MQRDWFKGFNGLEVLSDQRLFHARPDDQSKDETERVRRLLYTAIKEGDKLKERLVKSEKRFEVICERTRSLRDGVSISLLSYLSVLAQLEHLS